MDKKIGETKEATAEQKQNQRRLKKKAWWKSALKLKLRKEAKS
jgi:hypothetical protein